MARPQLRVPTKVPAALSRKRESPTLARNAKVSSCVRTRNAEAGLRRCGGTPEARACLLEIFPIAQVSIYACKHCQAPQPGPPAPRLCGCATSNSFVDQNNIQKRTARSVASSMLWCVHQASPRFSPQRLHTESAAAPGIAPDSWQTMATCLPDTTHQDQATCKCLASEARRR